MEQFQAINIVVLQHDARGKVNADSTDLIAETDNYDYSELTK